MRTGLVSDDAGVRYSFRQPVQRSVVQAWNTSTYTGAGLARWGETIYFATLLPSSGGAVDVQLWSSGSNGLSFTALWRERVCDSCGQPPPAGHRGHSPDLYRNVVCPASSTAALVSAAWFCPRARSTARSPVTRSGPRPQGSAPAGRGTRPSLSLPRVRRMRTVAMVACYKAWRCPARGRAPPRMGTYLGW